MRKYTLASPAAKNTVDLRDYCDVISRAVHTYIPTANVKVERNCYYVSPTPSQGDAVRIGRLICQSTLKEYCVQIPKLFSSIEIKEESNDDSVQKLAGGHH